MANSQRKRQILNQPLGGGAGGGGPYPAAYAAPIVTTYDPTTSDQGDAIGQIWANTVGGTAFILASQSGNVSTWVSVSSSSSTVSSLTITGAIPGSFTVNNMPTGALISSNPSTTSGAISSVALTLGKFLIGTGSGASNSPAAGTITSTGGTITVTNSGGNINIEQTGNGIAWSTKAASFNAAVNNGYVITPVGRGTVTATLPTVAALGNTIEILYPGATANDILKITGTAGSLNMSGDATARTSYTWQSNGVAGQANPSVTLICIAASATVPQWQLTEVDGSPTGS